VNEEKDRYEREVEHLMTLSSDAPDGATRLQAYLDAALAHYVALSACKRDTLRYLYMPFERRNDGDDGVKKTSLVYKQYKVRIWGVELQFALH
jgi:hypothetical protein